MAGEKEEVIEEVIEVVVDVMIEIVIVGIERTEGGIEGMRPTDGRELHVRNNHQYHHLVHLHLHIDRPLSLIGHHTTDVQIIPEMIVVVLTLVMLLP